MTINRGKRSSQKKKPLSQCHYFSNKSHKDWPVIEPRPAAIRLSYSMACEKSLNLDVSKSSVPTSKRTNHDEQSLNVVEGKESVFFVRIVRNT